MDFIRSGGLSVSLDNRVYSFADGLPNTPGLQNIDGVDTYGGYLDYESFLAGDGNTFSTHPHHIWRWQPHVRTVVKFLAKNAAQLVAHSFSRGDNGDRIRNRETAAAKLMANPMPYKGGRSKRTPYEFMFDLIVDLCMWDRYAAMVTMGDHGWQISRLDPATWKFHRDSISGVEGIRQNMPNGDSIVWPLDNFLWLDTYPSKGSPIDAIKRILVEQDESAKYSAQLWENGARLDVVIRRPLAAPSWSKPVRDKFKSSWSGGTKGGTRLLEDGMKVQEVNRLSPHDAQQVAARVISKAEVSSFFGVDATLVGASDSANYSNVSAYNEILDSAVLSSFVVQVQQAYNLRLLPIVGAAPDEYVEFSTTRNQGNLGEQMEAIAKATGVPTLTPNEGREKLNLPRFHDDPAMDKLVIPIYIQDPEANPTEEPTP